MQTRTGLPNDVLTFWIRRGLLLPREAPAGTGKHLRFDWYEANIAAVMAQLRNFGVPIDGLLAIASRYRSALNWANKYELNRKDTFTLWTLRALQNRYADEEDYANVMAQNLENWGLGFDEEYENTDRLIQMADMMPENEFEEHKDNYLSIAEFPDVDVDEKKRSPDMLTHFWRAGEIWRSAWGEDGPYQARDDGARATISVDVSGVIHDLWNRS